MSVTYKNLTGHRVTYNGISYESAGAEVRVPYELKIDGDKTVSVMDVKKVKNLPAPQGGVLYIVSIMVAMALQGMRNDLVIPVGMVKDKSGKPIECQHLAHLILQK